MIDAYLIGLAATLATAPLVSHTFGVVPLAGLAVNPPAIALAGVVVFGGALWMLAPVGVLAPAFGFVTGTAAGGIDALARLTASLPGGAADYTLGGWQTAALYRLRPCDRRGMECRTEKKRPFADVITSEEYTLLLTGEVQRAIAAARDRDPIEVAKDRRVPHARLVATQVKYLARAASKLRRMPPRSASSRRWPSSRRRARLAPPINGSTATRRWTSPADWASMRSSLSRRFQRVVTLERNDVLARVAAENFSRLGATNIEVVNTSAEEYLRRDGLRFDWIYADPDRRSAEGRKLVRPEDCSPDIIALKPLLNRVSGRLCIKNSPLFDIGEALRLFPDSRVEVVSLDGECKEVLVYADGTGPLVTATALGHGSFRPGPATRRPNRKRSIRRAAAGSWSPTWPCKSPAGPAPPRGKGRRLERKRLRIRRRRAAGVLGRVHAVERIEPYDPKRLKRELKGRGAEVLKRDFPLAAEELMRRLGLHPGAELRLAFTKIGNDFLGYPLKNNYICLISNGLL